MPGLTAGAQQISTWATGDIIMYAAAVGIVIAGFALFNRGVGMAIFLTTCVGLAIASGAMGISRSVYGWFHSAAIDVPAIGHALASATTAVSSLFA